MGSAPITPEQVERLGENGLKVRWSDGHESLYTWDLLRRSCPCAACRPPAGEAPRVTVTGGDSHSSVHPLEIGPVGRYAMTIRWSDGHTTGIFSHTYLRSLCPCEACQPRQMTEG